MNKRGQITLFIIIGILILFSFAIVYFVYSSATAKKEISARPVIEDVPAELNPVVLYVEECIRQTAENGLTRLGEQGGFISPEGSYDYENPTDSDGLLISENSQTRIPYWLYNEEANNGEIIECSSNAPQLKRQTGSARDMSIEAQLDRYMNENLGLCIDDFREFTAQGYDFESGNIDTTTTIVDNKITFFVEYGISISIGEREYELEKFYTELDVPLKQMYELAQEIKDNELEYHFLEKSSLNLMESFSSLSVNSLPPMTASTFEFGSSSTWPADDVEENIKNMLTSYVPLMGIYNSVDYSRYVVPSTKDNYEVQQKVYDNLMIDLQKPVPYKINFDYLGWPMYIDMNDNSGVIEPQSVSVSFAGLNLGVQRYKTVYDLSYPVLTTIEAPNALNNKGYRFAFALEANIRNNKEIGCGEQLLESYEFFEQTQLCNPEQRNSPEFTISVKDNYDNFELSGVQVMFSAGEESCFIAETASELKTRLPVAVGGMLTFIKQGYVTKSVPVDTSIEGDAPEQFRHIEVKLDKYKEIEIGARKKKLVKCIKGVCYPGSGFPVPSEDNGWVLKSREYKLEDDEEAIIMLKKMSENENNEEVGVSIRGDETKTIRLAPGTYEIDIQMILDKELKIPEERRCIETKEDPLGLTTEEECYTINKTVFESFASGGANLEWELKESSFNNANKIIFRTVSIALDEVPEEKRKIEDIEQISRITNISEQHYEELVPRIE